MKLVTSTRGKWDGLILPMKKRSHGWNGMKMRHECYNLLKWQVVWYGHAH